MPAYARYLVMVCASIAGILVIVHGAIDGSATELTTGIGLLGAGGIIAWDHTAG